MSKIQFKTEKVIDVGEWDRVVVEAYGRPYKFQRQDGAKSRETFHFTVPDADMDYENDNIPEEVNHEIMGVSFKAWLERDPKQKLSKLDEQEDYCCLLWWESNFYPNVQMVANGLYKKGLSAVEKSLNFY